MMKPIFAANFLPPAFIIVGFILSNFMIFRVMEVNTLTRLQVNPRTKKLIARIIGVKIWLVIIKEIGRIATKALFILVVCSMIFCLSMGHW